MNESTKGVIAYLFGWLGGLIILLGYKDSEKLTKFHAAQAITISIIYCIASIALGFIPYVRYVTYLLSPAYFVVMILGCVKAYKLQEYELPVVSDLARKWFAKQIGE